MGRMRRVRRVAFGLAVTTLWWAGCQSPGGNVIGRLPDPALTGVGVGGPLPGRNPSAGKTPAESSSEATWLPPGGLTRKWTCIIVHHSASRFGSLRDIDRWHRAKGWDGCGYDFVIGNGTRSPDGRIEVSLRWRKQKTGAHTRIGAKAEKKKRLTPNYYNEYGIGICLVGEFDKRPPSAKQKAALARLVRFLTRKCKIPLNRVVRHGELKSTACPGARFGWKGFKRQVQALP